MLGLLRRIRSWLKAHKQATPDVVIRCLNPLLTNWAQYYRHVVSKQTFDYVKHQVWAAIWTWCKRRHPQKSYRWIKDKYFMRHDGRDWRFYAEIRTDGGEWIQEFLADVSELQIQRHIKVRGEASPDNPALKDYWRQRAKRSWRLARCGRTTASYVHDLLEA